MHPTFVKNINGNKGFFRWPDWLNVLLEGAKIYITSMYNNTRQGIASIVLYYPHPRKE
jgi:hypothetical protein